MMKQIVYSIVSQGRKAYCFSRCKTKSTGFRFGTMATTQDKFKETVDRYNGVTIDTKELKMNDAEFEETLNSSVARWQQSGIHGVWFKVNLSNSTYVPVLVKNGFDFHHAKKSYVMLSRWLPDTPDLLPQFPFTHIGVGGMVVNERNQVLVVQEKNQQHWKLPGGYSIQGEDFSNTARREVLEETGVDTEFISVISLRHMHQHQFQCGDIYVVCYMKPLSHDIRVGEEEISLCQWMDIEEYRNHPKVTEFNKFIMDSFLESLLLKTALVAKNVLSFDKKSYNKVYSVRPLPSKDELS